MATRLALASRRIAWVVALTLALLPAPVAAGTPDGTPGTCEEQARAVQADEAWLEAEVRRLRAHAAADWAVLHPQAEACLAMAKRADRRKCARRVAAFVDDARSLTATPPVRSSTPPPVCDTPPAMSPRAVTVPQLAYAELLLEKLGAPFVAPEPTTPGSPVPPDVIAVRAELEAWAHTARLESIERLRELLGQSCGDTSTRVLMLLRLAALYDGAARGAYLVEARACRAGPGCTGVAHVDSTAWTEQSAKLLARLLEFLPDSLTAQRAEARFHLGLALLALGRDAEAHTQLLALVTESPGSPYAPDAYVLMADHEPGTHWADEALLAWQRAHADRQGDRYAYAVYRRALAREAAGEGAKASRMLELAIEAARIGGDLALEAEALAALGRAGR